MSSGAVVVGLWSIILEPGKTVSQNVSPGIQITNVSFGPEITGNERTVVTVKYPEFEQTDSEDEDEDEEEEEDDDEDIKLPKLITKQAVIALLRPDVCEQVSVNITLVEDVEVVEFTVTGPNAVHLVGHYVRQEDFDQDPYSDSEEGDFDSDDEEIDSDLENLEGLSGMLGEEDDEMDSEGDSERFAELLEEAKASATVSKKRVAEEVAAEELAGDESMSSNLSKNQRKKLAKKQKSTDGTAVAVEAPVVAAKAAPAKVEKKAAVVENKIAEKKVEKKGPVTREVAPGVEVTDTKVGDGAVAKNGKKIGMRYIGKLDNGKIFDSNTKGSPLSFTLGRGEVIAGWEKGIVGMQVGGERKLKLAASVAYGKKGTTGIPGGATLHFDVKLVSLNERKVRMEEIEENKVEDPLVKRSVFA